MSVKPTKQKPGEPPTTGHSWDGIEEFDNPMPRWWLWTFYVTIVWAIGYSILYPAWPLINGATNGLIGHSTRADVQRDIEAFAEANATIRQQLVNTDLTAIAADPNLLQYATNAGAAVFRTNCVQCHGSGAAGNVGYPNLLDDDWLWGGDIESIHTTVTHGIRNTTDDEARYSEMPRFGADGLLDSTQISQVVEYVLQISGQDHDAALSAEGATIFADNCAACHGEDGTGSRDVGAPNLTDAIWLYGGDRATVTETVTYARFGVMPNWNARLTEADIRSVAVYVPGLGGGE
jgi:cytochrome c oxidase cbb3-type subunit 3